MDEEKQYTLAFNNGYLLAEHEPVLLNSIFAGSVPKGNYLEGLSAGGRQQQIDLEKEQLFVIEKLRDQSRGIGKEIGRE